MHIAHIVPTLDESYGGTAITALNLGESQAKIGEQVSYWATGEKKSSQGVVAAKDSVFLYRTQWPHRWFRSSGFVRGLKERIDSIDILQTHGIWQYTSYAAAKIARKADVPYIIRPTGVFMHSWRYQTAKKQIYSYLFGNRMIKGAACFHVASEQEAEGCKAAGFRIPITIVPNGVNPKDFEDLPEPFEIEEKWPVFKDRLVVLFLSLISPVKGLDQCLPAIKSIIETGKYKELLFVIAGPDYHGYRSIVEGSVKNNDLESHVLFTGMVKGKEKIGLFRRADIFILPSYSENFGLVVAEALACGTPVITTTGTPWKAIENIEAGFWVPPERNAFFEAFQHLLDKSEDVREAMGSRGREYILKNYTWENAAHKMIKVYQCLLDGKEVPLYPMV